MLCLGYHQQRRRIIELMKGEEYMATKELMSEIIWTGEVRYSGQYLNGRVVRWGVDGDLAFEVELGHDAMWQKIWKHYEQGAFREFLIHCGNVLVSAQKK